MSAAHEIEKHFPLLAATGYRITSKDDRRYNCIAWAAGRTHRFWWPIGPPGEPTFWPAGVPRELTLEAFEKAFESLGFQRCDDAKLEPGIEKVAIFAVGETPTHAARQFPNGRWSSKLGKDVDVEHNVLAGVSSGVYGRPVRYLQRPRKPAQAPLRGQLRKSGPKKRPRK